jgi:hypothetical protein
MSISQSSSTGYKYSKVELIRETKVTAKKKRSHDKRVAAFASGHEHQNI